MTTLQPRPRKLRPMAISSGLNVLATGLGRGRCCRADSRASGGTPSFYELLRRPYVVGFPEEPECRLAMVHLRPEIHAPTNPMLASCLMFPCIRHTDGSCPPNCPARHRSIPPPGSLASDRDLRGTPQTRSERLQDHRR